MRGLIALIVVVYLVGVGVALAPTVQSKWNTASAAEQAKRFEADPWEQTICEFVAGRQRVSVTEVARDALGLEVSKVGTTEQRRISGVLIDRGWTAGRDGRGRFYAAPA
jgi:hypothetical protein